jgi:FERM central domain
LLFLLLFFYSSSLTTTLLDRGISIAELGDYDPRKHAYGYVSEFRLLSNQTRDLEQRICELHQQLKGINPSQAELNYLDKVKWNDMYGVDLHPVLVSVLVIPMYCQRDWRDWRGAVSAMMLRMNH